MFGSVLYGTKNAKENRVFHRESLRKMSSFTSILMLQSEYFDINRGQYLED